MRLLKASVMLIVALIAFEPYELSALSKLKGAASPLVLAQAADTSDYSQHLAYLKSSSVRNTNHESSIYKNTPMTALPKEALLGPRSDYIENPGGNPEDHFPSLDAGNFRISCEFSHFAYDDPLVYPNQAHASHLHMFWGNTDTNAFSSFESLMNSGSSTCNGMELNRSAYWAPAMFDAEGNVRIPERIGIYYKGYGLANGKSVVFPEGAAMLAKTNIHLVPANAGGAEGEFGFQCSNQWRGSPRTPAANTIPVCDGSKFGDSPRTILEMHVKFPNCWNRQDPANPANWQLARQGSWFGSDCQERATVPNIEYIIQYPLEPGETTEGWYLASDINPETLDLKGGAGASVHADWWGAWHPEVMNMWIENCVNFDNGLKRGCGHGYLSDAGPDKDNPLPGPALKFRPQYTGPIKVAASLIYKELCDSQRDLSQAEQAAHCKP